VASVFGWISKPLNTTLSDFIVQGRRRFTVVSRFFHVLQLTQIAGTFAGRSAMLPTIKLVVIGASGVGKTSLRGKVGVFVFDTANWLGLITNADPLLFTF
jgi:hypothetical protein